MTRLSKALILSWLGLIPSASASFADTHYSSAPLEQLIDELTFIDAPAPGLNSTAWFTAFVAEDKPPRFAGGVLGSPPPQTPQPMRELVRRGLRALPALIEHLQDDRPTRLSVGGNFLHVCLFRGRVRLAESTAHTGSVRSLVL